MARPTVAVDLDGVVHDTSQGWNHGKLGEPMPGCRDGLTKLSRRYDLVLFTARHDLDYVTAWLRNHRLDHYFKNVTNRKPTAVAYLDDRAVRFIAWDQVPDDLG